MKAVVDLKPQEPSLPLRTNQGFARNAHFLQVNYSKIESILSQYEVYLMTFVNIRPEALLSKFHPVDFAPTDRAEAR